MIQDKLSSNDVPDPSDWNTDSDLWDDRAGDSCFDFEEEKIERSNQLSVPVNFEYELDSNGNPTLLIPNIDSTRIEKGRTFNKVEYDQTASHLHHAPEFGIVLPSGFDMKCSVVIQFS